MPMPMPQTFHVSTGPAGWQGALALLVFLIGLAVTIFWMVVGWRAMRAHERIADQCERNLPALGDRPQAPPNPAGGETDPAPKKQQWFRPPEEVNR